MKIIKQILCSKFSFEIRLPFDLQNQHVMFNMEHNAYFIRSYYPICLGNLFLITHALVQASVLFIVSRDNESQRRGWQSVGSLLRTTGTRIVDFAFQRCKLPFNTMLAFFIISIKYTTECDLIVFCISLIPARCFYVIISRQIFVPNTRIWNSFIFVSFRRLTLHSTEI